MEIEIEIEKEEGEKVRRYAPKLITQAAILKKKKEVISCSGNRRDCLLLPFCWI